MNMLEQLSLTLKQLRGRKSKRNSGPAAPHSLCSHGGGAGLLASNRFCLTESLHQL